MNNHPDHLDYNDFDAMIRRAHMERSVAVGSAIASVVSGAALLIRRAMAALSPGAGKVDGHATPNAPAQR